MCQIMRTINRIGESWLPPGRQTNERSESGGIAHAPRIGTIACLSRCLDRDTNYGRNDRKRTCPLSSRQTWFECSRRLVTPFSTSALSLPAAITPSVSADALSLFTQLWRASLRIDSNKVRANLAKA